MPCVEQPGTPVKQNARSRSRPALQSLTLQLEQKAHIMYIVEHQDNKDCSWGRDSSDRVALGLQAVQHLGHGVVHGRAGGNSRPGLAT